MVQQSSSAGERAAPSLAQRRIENTQSLSRTHGLGHLDIIRLVNASDQSGKDEKGKRRQQGIPKVSTPPFCRIVCALNVSGRGGVVLRASSFGDGRLPIRLKSSLKS